MLLYALTLMDIVIAAQIRRHGECKPRSSYIRYHFMMSTCLPFALGRAGKGMAGIGICLLSMLIHGFLINDHSVNLWIIANEIVGLRLTNLE